MIEQRMKDRYMIKLFVGLDEEGKLFFRIVPVLHPGGEPEDELGYFMSGRQNKYHLETNILDIKDDLNIIEKEVKKITKRYEKIGRVTLTKMIPVGEKRHKGHIMEKGDINDLNYRFFI